MSFYKKKHYLLEVQEMSSNRKCDNCGRLVFRKLNDNYINIFGYIDGDVIELDFCSFDCIRKHFEMGARRK